MTRSLVEGRPSESLVRMGAAEMSDDHLDMHIDYSLPNTKGLKVVVFWLTTVLMVMGWSVDSWLPTVLMVMGW